MAVTEARFVELPCAPAVCRGPAGARGSAARLLVGRLALPALELPDTGALVVPGRVHSLGRFENDGLHTVLADALPAALRNSLRTGFEWYACRGAFFHSDAHYGTVLFGAWCVAGPPREIVFARAGTRTPAGPGDWVIFDPFEPHAVLDPDTDRYARERYAGAPASLFIGFELRLDERVLNAFAIAPEHPDAPVLASSVAIHAETGALC